MSLGEILSFAFVQRALLAGVLIAAVAAILGVFLVLRRLSLIGDGLAHITFGSVAIVLLIGISPFYVTLAALPLGVLGLAAMCRALGVSNRLSLLAGCTWLFGACSRSKESSIWRPHRG